MAETHERAMPRALKAAVAAFVLLGLLGIVALGARGSHPGASYHARQREVPAQVGNDLMTLAIIVYGIGLLVLVASFLTFRHEWITPRSRWLRDLFVTLVVCCFLTLVGYQFFRHHGPLRGLRQSGQNVTGTAGLKQTDTRATLPQLAASKKSAQFDWAFAAALGGLALGTAALFLVTMRRRPARTVEALAVEEELGAAVDDSIDDLRREPDARRAVIASYARMESVLRRHGRARRPAEAPYEYLERVLRELRVRPRAANDLTELFERAKFSVHTIDRTMKERAIDALLAIREDLVQP